MLIPNLNLPVLSAKFDHSWLLRMVVFPTLLDSPKVQHLGPYFFTVSHLESLKRERDALQVQLQNQKFTPADVERINREKRELQQTITSLNKSLEDAEQHKWNEEIALAKVKEKVPHSVLMCLPQLAADWQLPWLLMCLSCHGSQAELRLSEYHKLARKLKLIPLSAENACGHDFEIRPFECGSSNTVQHKTQVGTCWFYCY